MTEGGRNDPARAAPLWVPAKASRCGWCCGLTGVSWGWQAQGNGFAERCAIGVGGGGARLGAPLDSCAKGECGALSGGRAPALGSR